MTDAARSVVAAPPREYGGVDAFTNDTEKPK